MNASIRAIIDHMFRDTADNTETRALHEELLNNCLEHYEDLVSRGMSETEAIDAVVDSLKGMKEVIDEYPRKQGSTSTEDNTVKTVPVISEKEREESSGDRSADDKPSEYSFRPDTVRKIRTDLKSSDLKIGCSADDKIHIRCEDMDQLICVQEGETLSVRLVDKTRQKIVEAGKEINNGDLSLKSLMSFIGKAIGSVAAGITVDWDVYIDLPPVSFEEMDLNSKSGEIFVKAMLPDKLLVHSMSGDIEVEASGSGSGAKVTISAMSGDIDFSGNADHINLSSMSGDVEVHGSFTSVELKSTSGDADLYGEAKMIRANSVSGDVTIGLRNTNPCSVEASSTSGDVDIELAKGTDRINPVLTSVSGSTSCQVPAGGADACVQVRAKSVSGDVTVR